MPVSVIVAYNGSQLGFTLRNPELEQESYVATTTNCNSIAIGENNDVYLTSDNHIYHYTLNGTLIKDMAFPDSGIVYTSVAVKDHKVYLAYAGSQLGVTIRDLSLNQLSYFSTGITASGISVEHNHLYLSSKNHIYHYDINGSLIQDMEFPVSTIEYTGVAATGDKVYVSYKGSQQGFTVRDVNLNQISYTNVNADINGIAASQDDVYLVSANHILHYTKDGKLVKDMAFPVASINYTSISIIPEALAETTVPTAPATPVPTAPATPPTPVTPTPPIVINSVNNIECLSDCFARMGKETREFVINVVKQNLAELVNNEKFSVYITQINKIIELLDGNEEQEGFQQFIALINNVSQLMAWQSTSNVDITDIKNYLKGIKNGDININIDTLLNNQEFISRLSQNTVILNQSVANITNVITNNINGANDTTIDTFIKSLSSFVDARINVAVKNVNVKIDTDISNVQNNITKMLADLNIQFSTIRQQILVCVTKEELTQVENKFNQCCATYQQLVEQVKNLQIQINSINAAQLDISQNISVININNQLANYQQVITNLSAQLSNFVTKQDLAIACQTACKAFLDSLNISNIPKI